MLQRAVRWRDISPKCPAPSPRQPRCWQSLRTSSWADHPESKGRCSSPEFCKPINPIHWAHGHQRLRPMCHLGTEPTQGLSLQRSSRPTTPWVPPGGSLPRPRTLQGQGRSDRRRARSSSPPKGKTQAGCSIYFFAAQLQLKNLLLDNATTLEWHQQVSSAEPAKKASSIQTDQPKTIVTCSPTRPLTTRRIWFSPRSLRRIFQLQPPQQLASRNDAARRQRMIHAASLANAFWWSSKGEKTWIKKWTLGNLFEPMWIYEGNAGTKVHWSSMMIYSQLWPSYLFLHSFQRKTILKQVVHHEPHLSSQC